MDSALTALPDRQKTIITDDGGNLAVSYDLPIPKMEPDMLLIRTKAVALNPVDVKLTGSMGNPGTIAGCDLAGIVIAIGTMVTRFSVGDRVGAVVPGSNSVAPVVGAFAEYSVTYEDFTWKLCDHMTFEDAATLGISVTVTGYALFYSLTIPGHPETPVKNATMPYVLIYGGSTASGTMAIQMARKSGMIPITICSPRNFALVQEYGAEKAFDYHDPKSAQEIRDYTKDFLYYALDCFCDSASMIFCYASIGRAGGSYTTLEPFNRDVAHTRNAIKPDWVINSAILGKTVGWKEPYGVQPMPEVHAFGKEWSRCIQRMLDANEIKTHPTRVDERAGLEGILDGAKLIRDGAISGMKLYMESELPRIQNQN